MSASTTDTKVPAWKYALPVITFSAGFAYGKIVKKCWGCAVGFGFTAGALGAIPLGLHYAKIHSIGMKAAESNPETKAEPKGETKPAVVDVKTADVVNAIEGLAISQKKAGAFADKKEKITQAIDSLDNKEKTVLMEMMALGKAMTDKNSNPQTSYAAVMNKMSQLQKTYGEKFMSDFSKKMKEVESNFGISLNAGK